MLNKNLFLLIATLALASCSANKKNVENISSLPKEPKEVALKEEEIFSVSADEIKKSESGSHVVYFSKNSAKLDSESTSILKEKVLEEAKSSNTKRVFIEAHCDERGSDAYNQKLSEKRAKSVKNYLVKNGVKNAKVKTVGYGESKPVALGHDETSWAKNRRAVTISIKK